MISSSSFGLIQTELLETCFSLSSSTTTRFRTSSTFWLFCFSSFLLFLLLTLGLRWKRLLFSGSSTRTPMLPFLEKSLLEGSAARGVVRCSLETSPVLRCLWWSCLPNNQSRSNLVCENALVHLLVPVGVAYCICFIQFSNTSLTYIKLKPLYINVY